MAKHTSFGLTSRSTSVYENAALTWFLSEALFNDYIVRHIFAELEEIGPMIDAAI
jgi:hypothetical protein